MTKIFKVPFADTGDKISPPDAIQPDGSVGYGLGYGWIALNFSWDRLAVNQDLSAFELAGYINQVEPRIFVTRVETSEDGVVWSSDDVIIKLNEVARLPKSAIQVVVA